jgi:hypothetical protein
MNREVHWQLLRISTNAGTRYAARIPRIRSMKSPTAGTDVRLQLPVEIAQTVDAAIFLTVRFFVGQCKDF